MIAKVTASGAGVAGLIEYVYDGREDHRLRGDKKAEVIIHSENLQMPRDANDLVGRRALIKDFDNRAKQRNEKFDYVGMHVLSFTHDDIKKLNKAKITDLCQEYVEMANLKNTQYFAIAHNDTDHYHIHFVFNRIDNKGKNLVLTHKIAQHVLPRQQKCLLDFWHRDHFWRIFYQTLPSRRAADYLRQSQFLRSQSKVSQQYQE